MTEYSHQAVGEVMARIMDNVIRLFMSESQWYGTWDEGFRGNGWDGDIPGKFDGSGKVVLRQNVSSQTAVSPAPPGAVYLGDETVGYVSYYKYEIDPRTLYDPWVERVNTLFEGWRSLPDPADFDAPIAALEQAVDDLTPEAQRDGSYTFVDVAVTSAIGRMHTWVSPQGDTNLSDLLYAFDSPYGPDRITGVMINQAQVAAGLGFTVAGEKQVWTKARQDLMRISGEAADAMDVTGGGGGLSIDLGVVKSFVDLVSVFVPAQYKVLTSAVSAGLGFLDQIIPEQTTEAKAATIDGFTADELMTSLERAIRDLETSIFDEEAELRSKLSVLSGILGGRAAGDFHLHPGAGIDTRFTGDAARIRIDSTAVQRVGTEDVPVVASAFLQAAESASSHTGPGIWTRDNLIGYGSTGAYYPWHSLIEQFDAVTTGSGRELVEAGKILAVAAGWIEDADVEAGLASRGLKDELDRGQTEWSYS